MRGKQVFPSEYRFGCLDCEIRGVPDGLYCLRYEIVQKLKVFTSIVQDDINNEIA